MLFYHEKRKKKSKSLLERYYHDTIKKKVEGNMNELELEREINEYGKYLATLILKDYQESLGKEKELYVYQLTLMDFITLDKSKKQEYALFLSLPSNQMSYDLAITDLKNKLPYQLFSLFIDPDKKDEEKSELEKLMIEDLTVGLREIYAKRFCEKHHIPHFFHQKKLSTNIALDLLNHNFAEIDEDKMVFQTNYIYMKQMYSISTHGRNLVHDYDMTYLTPRKLEELKGFLQKYFSVDTYYPLYEQSNSLEFVVSHLTTEILNHYDEEQASKILEEFSRLFVKEKEVTRQKKKNSSGHLSGIIIPSSCFLLALIFFLTGYFSNFFFLGTVLLGTGILFFWLKR